MTFTWQLAARLPMRTPSRAVRFALLAVALLLTLSGCGRGPAPEAATGLTMFAPAERVDMPEISGPSLDGTERDLTSLRGRVVVLNSWASWCAPCRDEIPRLREAAKAHPEIEFLGLNVKDDAKAAVAFAADTDITWPSITDPDGILLPTIPGVPPAALPSTVVIDPQGRIAVRIIGPVKGTELLDALATVASEASAG